MKTNEDVYPENPKCIEIYPGCNGCPIAKTELSQAVCVSNMQMIASLDNTLRVLAERAKEATENNDFDISPDIVAPLIGILTQKDILMDMLTDRMAMNTRAALMFGGFSKKEIDDILDVAINDLKTIKSVSNSESFMDILKDRDYDNKN